MDLTLNNMNSIKGIKLSRTLGNTGKTSERDINFENDFSSPAQI